MKIVCKKSGATSNYPTYLIVNNIYIVVFLICPTSEFLECKYYPDYIFWLGKQVTKIK